MFDIPDWLGTILTGAGSALIGWYVTRKKENADINTQTTERWIAFSDKMEARELKLQNDLDRLRVDFEVVKIELAGLKIENMKLLAQLSRYQPVQATTILLAPIEPPLTNQENNP